MKIIFIISISILFLTSCSHKLPPCQGTEEQIEKCELKRAQEKQTKLLRLIYLKQAGLL